MKRKIIEYRKALYFICILLLGLFLSTKFQLRSYLTDINSLKEIKTIIDNNYIVSTLLYLTFTIIGSSVLALPGITFAIIAGALFGPWLGSFYCLLGTTFGSILSFLLSRYLLRDSIKELVKKNEILYNIIFQTNSDKEFLILMITRLLPIFPFNLQNFAYGITNISIVKYSIGTFLFMIPGIIIFSLGTEGFLNVQNRNQMSLIVIIILSLMVLAGVYLYNKYKMLMIREQNER